MKQKWAIINKLQTTISTWLFVTKYVYLLMCCSVPPLLLIGGIVRSYDDEIKNFTSILYSELTNTFSSKGINTTNITSYITFYEVSLITIFYILCLITIFSSLIISHRKFLSNYSSKKFRIYRDNTVKSDIKFISAWLFLSSIFHIFLMFFGFEGNIYILISRYLVLNTMFYFLIHTKRFGHSIKQRTAALKT